MKPTLHLLVLFLRLVRYFFIKFHFELIVFLEKFEPQADENSFANFLELPMPKTSISRAIEEFGSCELDEKAFVNEIIHESNSYNENWLQE